MFLSSVYVIIRHGKVQKISNHRSDKFSFLVELDMCLTIARNLIGYLLVFLHLEICFVALLFHMLSHCTCFTVITKFDATYLTLNLLPINLLKVLPPIVQPC